MSELEQLELIASDVEARGYRAISELMSVSVQDLKRKINRYLELSSQV